MFRGSETITEATHRRTLDTVVAATGKTRVFDILLKHDYNINLCLGHVGDALILANCADRTSFIAYLLHHGTDPNANTRSELYTPLECAAPSCSLATIRLLLEHGAQLSSRRVLCRAAFYGQGDVVSCLLAHGAAIDEIPANEHIDDGEREQGVGTALHAAVEGGRVEVARRLLERGPRTDLRDSNGWTAVEFGRLRGETSLVELLTGQ
ncbi:hypothetical protein MMC17_005130 [Xylographa soralifera]|nr:hypothetical protein [Xylographa soralifera]